jgi:hypothetical protein
VPKISAAEFKTRDAKHARDYMVKQRQVMTRTVTSTPSQILGGYLKTDHSHAH